MPVGGVDAGTDSAGAALEVTAPDEKLWVGVAITPEDSARNSAKSNGKSAIRESSVVLRSDATRIEADVHLIVCFHANFEASGQTKQRLNTLPYHYFMGTRVGHMESIGCAVTTAHFAAHATTPVSQLPEGNPCPDARQTRSHRYRQMGS